MSDNHAASPAPPNQTLRLVLSWVVVGVPLVYALWQTISSVIPLFTS